MLISESPRNISESVFILRANILLSVYICSKMGDSKDRGMDDINNILHLAKLTEDTITPLSQTLYFTDTELHDNNYKLLELDPYLLQQITTGQTLYIKGDDDDNVVVCSDSRTYDVVETETSNSLLLTRGVKYSEEAKKNEKRQLSKCTISGIFYEYLEVIPGKPHLKKLRSLLEKSVYKGPEHEFAVDKSELLSHAELVQTIQASEQELRDVLSEMDVVTLDGKVRLLDFEFHFRVLSFMLKLIEENSWNLDEIVYEDTINSLENLCPNQVLDCLFDKYASETKIIDGSQLYGYKEEKVCQFFAQVLLKYAEKFNLQEFMRAWQESVPEGMIVDEGMLYGIAVIDRKSNPNVIWAYDEELLPDNINERLSVLFQMKEKWTVPEITPYIKRLTTEKLDANALLAKYARASKTDGVKYYSTKHSK